MKTLICTVPDSEYEAVVSLLRLHGGTALCVGEHAESGSDLLMLIHKVACQIFGADWKEARTTKRDRELVTVRDAVAQCASVWGVPFRVIGRYYGRDDHSAMVCAAKRARHLIQTDPDYRRQYRALAHAVQSGYQQDINTNGKHP